MRTRILLVIILLIHALIRPGQIAAQTQTTIYTPKSQSVTAYYLIPEMGYQDKLDWSDEVALVYPQATELNPPSATTSYNCHGYAWHVSEGGSIRWIGYYYGQEDHEDIYWTAQNPSYIETTEANASKISYYEDNHSAIQTSTQGIYISKWGEGPLMEHARGYGPEDYEMDYRKYYKLNPIVTGNFSELCSTQQRTFSSDVEISGSTYSWTRSTSLLDYVSGQGSNNYRVEAKSGVKGVAAIRVAITTPSGAIDTSQYKNFWVGVPDKNNIEIVNPYNHPDNTLCEGEQNQLVGSNNSYPIIDFDWDYSGWSHFEVGATDDISFVTVPYPFTYKDIKLRAANECGESDWRTQRFYPNQSCGYFFGYSPNPADDYVEISPDETKLAENKIDYYEVRIYNSLNVAVFQTGKTKESLLRIHTKQFQNGVYFIHFIAGKKIDVKQLVVSH